jgi:glutamine amidotransferase
MVNAKRNIVVIDYGAGNLGSVTNALTCLGYHFIVNNQPDTVKAAHAVILPGVGAAGDCMQKLKATGINDTIAWLVRQKKPLLAICIGLQVLFTSTEEGGLHQCLNIIPGHVRRLPAGLKIPHMGWNEVRQEIKHPIFKGIPDRTHFYFVHSYYAEPDDRSSIAGRTDYGINFCSMVIKENVIATQFHPEKSGAAGLRMYSNFLQMALGKE